MTELTIVHRWLANPRFGSPAINVTLLLASSSVVWAIDHAPVVELVPPEAPAIGEVTVLALACDESIREVGFWLDGSFVSADRTPPFELKTDLGEQVANHTVRALAIDRQKVVVGEDHIELNRPLPKFVADFERGENRIRVHAQAAPAALVPTGYRVFAAATELTQVESPILELEIANTALGDTPFLRVEASYKNGERVDRFLILQEGFSETIEVNEVQLWITVADRLGRPVADLNPDDFQLHGANMETQIQRADPEPVTLALILDGSYSMASQRKFLRPATEALATEVLGEDDRLLLFDVAYRPRLLNPSGDPKAVPALLDDMVNGGGSALYDSIYFAVRQLENTPGPKGLILLSDGVDEHSHTKAETVAAVAWSAGVPVFLVNGEHPRAGLDRIRAMNLRKFVERTGGRAFMASSSASQQAAMSVVVDHLRQHRYVAAVSAPADWDLDRLRQITVEVSNPELEPRVYLGRGG